MVPDTLGVLVASDGPGVVPKRKQDASFAIPLMSSVTENCDFKHQNAHSVFSRLVPDALGVLGASDGPGVVPKRKKDTSSGA